MRRILKFVLTPTVTTVETAGPLRALAVAWQADDLVLWVEAVVGTGHRTRFGALTTGQSAPDDAEYVGTAQHPTLNSGGPLVVHVYQRFGGEFA